MNLKLNEVLWEVTQKCNRNCTFCGSKSIINKKKDLLHEEKLLIAKKLNGYLQDGASVTFTGGEPLVIGIDVLEAYVRTIKKGGRIDNTKNISCRVVTNGDQMVPDFMELFDIVGWSINDENDIRHFENNGSVIDGTGKLVAEYLNKVTIVTNFGIHNIWEFDKIVEFIRKHEIKMWQVQLTMSKDGSGMLTEEGIKYLYGKLRTCNVSFVLADNLQTSHECCGGINGMSITFEGDVVSCLSKRSWCKEIEVVGNLLKEDLKTIWETRFHAERFEKCKCCRDCIKYPDVKPMTPINIYWETENEKIFIPDDSPCWPKKDAVYVYSAFPPNVVAYAIIDPETFWKKGKNDIRPIPPNSVILYNVISPTDIWPVQ